MYKIKESVELSSQSFSSDTRQGNRWNEMKSSRYGNIAMLFVEKNARFNWMRESDQSKASALSMNFENCISFNQIERFFG